AARREVLLVPYSDKISPLFAVLPVAVALLAVGAFWTATGWSEGLLAAEFTMIGYGLMSIQPNPTAGLRLYLVVIVSASCLEFIYLFGVLPALHGFVLLMLALALLLLPIGAFLPIPATALRALMLASLTVAFLSLQGVYSANFITSLNATLGVVGRAVQRCRGSSIESDPQHLRGEVKRAVRSRILESANL
ncbi:MAG: FUSC family protein, partial [Acetobacteraceae bacterium]